MSGSCFMQAHTLEKARRQMQRNYVKVWVPFQREYLLFRFFIAAEESMVRAEVEEVLGANSDARAAVFRRCNGELGVLPEVGEAVEYPERPSVSTENLKDYHLQYMRLMADGYPRTIRPKVEKNLAARGLARIIDGVAVLTEAGLECVRMRTTVEAA